MGKLRVARGILTRIEARAQLGNLMQLYLHSVIYKIILQCILSLLSTHHSLVCFLQWITLHLFFLAQHFSQAFHLCLQRFYHVTLPLSLLLLALFNLQHHVALQTLHLAQAFLQLRAVLEILMGLELDLKQLEVSKQWFKSVNWKNGELISLWH